MGWEQCSLPAPDPSGRTFYFRDHNTQTTHWELPAPNYEPPPPKELYEVLVPPGVPPGGEVMACDFHIRIPQNKYPGQKFVVEFIPTLVTVPDGACAGMRVDFDVNGLRGSKVVPKGFMPGQSFEVLAPAARSECGHTLHVNAPLPPNWTQHIDSSGRVYYQNEVLKTTQWEFPSHNAVPSPAPYPSIPVPGQHALYTSPHQAASAVPATVKAQEVVRGAVVGCADSASSVDVETKKRNARTAAEQAKIAQKNAEVSLTYICTAHSVV